MRSDFNDVQRIVLRGTPASKSHWQAVQHMMLRFKDGARQGSPLHFLKRLHQKYRPTSAQTEATHLQISLGFTRRGLERAHVPTHVMNRFALKSPAFWNGAALRAASRLGMTGPNGASQWAPNFEGIDAVLSIHATDEKQLKTTIEELKRWATFSSLCAVEPPLLGRALDPADKGPGQRVHFGFRDGLSHVGIEGWTKKTHNVFPRHAPGEFLLGRMQDCKSVSWITGPGLRVWPRPLRDFFRDGSFGVLHQIEQDVRLFDEFVGKQALSAELVKAKLCGRYPDGRLIGAAEGADPLADFDYQRDIHGSLCPFGSHIRRMNPRLRTDAGLVAGGQAAHSARMRPLLRRGVPYDSGWDIKRQRQECGLLGHFFCASIEDQYEHLIGEWAERVPLGTPDKGGARDPLIGNHEPGDGPFICQHEEEGKEAKEYTLSGFKPFTQTRGVVYLFYPSLSTLRRIAESSTWASDDSDAG